MSLKEAAQYLQSQGRGNDSRLMHVSPRELQSLQTLAKAKGGSLTLNPNTGLPEAGFLEDVLPVAAAGALMFMAPTLAPTIGGVFTGGASGALATGIGAGLLAGGSSLLTQALSGQQMNFGKAATTGALTGLTAGAFAPSTNVVTDVPALDLAKQTANIPLVQGDFTSPAASYTPPPVSANSFAYNAQGEMVPSNVPASITGSTNPLSGTAPPPGTNKSWWASLSDKEKLMTGLGGVAGLSLLAGANQPKIQTPASTSYIRPYTYSQTMNPNYGQPGQSYYNQRYTPLPTYQAAQGGLMGGPVEQMSQNNIEGAYPQSLSDRSNYAVSTQMPASAEVIGSDYDTRSNPYSGNISRMADGGTADSGYIPTSQAVQDYNKMLSSRATEEYLNNPMPSAMMPASQRSNIAAPPAAQAPAISQDINGLYQYYLGRQPGKDEVGQFANQINGPVTPEMAQYFQQFTGGELAKTGYKPKGPNPFLGEFGLLMGNPMSGPIDGSFPNAPQYTYNSATKSYMPVPQQYTPFTQPAPARFMDASSGGKAGGLMPSDLRFDKGGKAQGENMFEGLSEKEKRSMLMDMISAKLESPPPQYVEGLGLMTNPQSVGGRLGLNSEALGGNVRAGVSGNVMMTPDKKILANPGMMDVGYASKRESAYDPFYDVSLQRAIKSVPGRGRDYAVAANYTMPFAQGGQAGYNLGGYSDGGRLLKGPGDGMSDNIPASIGNKQPARLADGEFVIPADVVSHLGNGSTDAGAKKLYAMMDKVRTARVGTKKQGKEIKAEKYLKA